jgi:arylsulfatase A
MPSLVELAGAQIPSDIQIDGHSFAPLVLGQHFRTREWVFSEWNKKWWVRTQDWKLYQDGQLYDMNNDPNEKEPIDKDAKQPELKEIRKEFSDAIDKLNIE